MYGALMDYYSAVRTFVRVAETGSFTKASDRLEMPRNSVTRLVQALEAHLQVRLLNRTTRRVSLTNDGAAYYERMSRVIEEWQEAESDLVMAQRRPRGRVRVDMGSVIAVQLIIPALPRFYARYPDIQLDIGVSDVPIELFSHQVDCVVRGGHIDDPSLVARHIVDLPFVLCATKDYLLRHGTPAHPSDIERAHTLVNYFLAGSGRTSPIVLHSKQGDVTLQGRYQVAVNDANAQLAAGLAGLGILPVIRIAAQPHMNEGRLVPILEDWAMDPVPLSIVYAPNRHLSARVRVVVDWIKEICDAHPQARRARTRAPRQSSR
jgi:DNA-binding transcriptional LysR family regulator